MCKASGSSDPGPHVSPCSSTVGSPDPVWPVRHTYRSSTMGAATSCTGGAVRISRLPVVQERQRPWHGSDPWSPWPVAPPDPYGGDHSVQFRSIFLFFSVLAAAFICCVVELLIDQFSAVLREMRFGARVGAVRGRAGNDSNNVLVSGEFPVQFGLPLGAV